MIHSQNANNKNKIRKTLDKLLLLLLLLTIGGGVYWYLSIKPTPIVSGIFPSAKAAQKMTPDEMKDYAQKEVDKSNVTINVHPKVSVQENGTSATMWVQNIPINTTGQQAILQDKETGEVLAESGLIEPGEEVREIELTKKLTSGTHNGVILIEFYDLEKKEQIGDTSVNVQINVE